MQRRGPPIAITKSSSLAPTPARAAAVPIPPSFVSNAPSAFYRQHHAIEAPAVNEREYRTGWRVKSKLALLIECERIGRREIEAALSFKGWVENVGRTASAAWLAVKVDGGHRAGSGSLTPRQADAAQRLRNCSQALGLERIKLLVWVVVDDLPWTEIAKKLRLSTKTTTTRAVEAIEALACWRAGQPVPPSPITRLRIEPARW